MVDASSKEAIVKLGNSSIAHYSNALVRRAIEDIANKSPELLRSVTSKNRILLIANELGSFLKDILKAEGFEVYVVKSYGRLEEVYSELSSKEYDMVIPTNNSLLPEHILRLIPEIKLRFPKIRILVLSGWKSQDFILSLQNFKIDDFFAIPFDVDEFIPRVKNLLYHNK